MADRGRTEIEYHSPDTLEPHPLNDDVYGDRTDLDEALMTGTEKDGVVEPIVVDLQSDEGEGDDRLTIISGHRRVEASKEVELEKVRFA